MEFMTESHSPTINIETMSHAEAIACVQRLLKRLESWDALEKIILQQQEEITQLKARLSKDSHNSSKPPSSDGLARRAKSLRTKTGAKAGGQVGHVGSTLKKSSRIDHVIVHQLPRQCGVCGHSFNGMSSHEEAETRQVIDLPALRFEITEHRILRVQCRCGAQTCSSFPAEVISAVQYGPTIRAAAVYLNQYQQVPYQRCAAALQDLFGLRIAASSVVNYVRQVAAALRPEVAKIKETLLTQAAVHFDETGLRQGKTLVWTHSASTACLTWYGVHQKRGSEAINDFNILPRFKGVAIHDGMKSYRQYSCSHGLCNAHHLRELLFIFETTGEPWARAMMHLLCEAKELKSSLQCDGKELDSTQIKDIEQSHIRLLEQGMKAHPEKKRKASAPRQRGQVKQSDATNLLRRLFDYSDDVLRFTSDPNVPFDNNQAERDLRMIKLKQKISGCFRSWEGVDYFCTIRSYLSTLHKNKQNLYEALTQTFNGRAPAAV
jgi:transposase